MRKLIMTIIPLTLMFMIAGFSYGETEYTVTFTSPQGVSADVYEIGSISGGKITYNKKFAEYNVETTAAQESDWLAIASALNGYVKRDNISPKTSGESVSLANGAYLVCGEGTLASPQSSVAKIEYAITPYILVVDGANVSSELKVNTVDIPPEEKMSVKVIKEWNGEKVPVTMQLVKGNEVVDTVTLKDDTWSHVFENLPVGEYQVVEKDCPSGYENKTEQKGNTFIITNTKNDVPQPTVPAPTTPKPTTEKPSTTKAGETTTTTPGKTTTQASTTTQNPPTTVEKDTPSGKLPQTGTLWYLVAILAVLGVILFTVGYVRNRKQG